MGKLVDITGNRYGRLVVVGIDGSINKMLYWKCLCDCGTIKSISGSNLKSNKTSSCGCIKTEMLVRKNKLNAKHNMSGTPLYIVWDGINKRASETRVENKDTPNYRGRGIHICKEWDDNFMEFYKWAMSNGYKKGLQIDRIDNNSGYYPSNCRFVSALINSLNRRDTLDEEKIKKATDMYESGMRISDIAKKLNMKYSGLYQRLTGRRGVEKTMKHFKSKEN